jgi:hypothetical protein
MGEFMIRVGMVRGALAGGVLLTGALAVLPTQAGATTTYTGWTHREDGSAPGSDTTSTLPGAATLSTSAWGHWIGVYNGDSDPGAMAIGANFAPPAGQTLQAGRTYRADVLEDEPTATAGRMLVWHDNKICGKTESELFTGYPVTAPATGWFHVGEIQFDAHGNLVRFAATYEIDCQFVGGQPGAEGSIAMNASSPMAAVPAQPAAPGPVTGLKVTNVGPNGGGQNTTTLSWTNPAGFGDVNLDLVQVVTGAKLPALLGSNIEQRYRGRADHWSESMIDFMDSRIYRIVPRSTYGRLGPATLVKVIGSRFSTTDDTATIMIGQQAQVSGRLSESVAYDDPADVMKGPGLAGRTVVLCEQSTRHYVDGACTPVDQGVTDADGRFVLSAKPRENSMYSATVRASSGMVGNTTVVFIALVAPQTDLRAAESVDARELPARTVLSKRPSSVRRGSVIHFTTSRARAGSRGVVRLQRFNGKRWRTIATESLEGAAHGRRLAIPYREYKRGKHAYRVVKPADKHHVTGYSRVVYVKVR